VARLGGSIQVQAGRLCRVTPNPSLEPTRYGRRRKPAPRPSGIIATRAYAACLRGSAQLER
jgi:hypothetical protein